MTLSGLLIRGLLPGLDDLLLALGHLAGGLAGGFGLGDLLAGLRDLLRRLLQGFLGGLCIAFLERIGGFLHLFGQVRIARFERLGCFFKLVGQLLGFFWRQAGGVQVA